MLKVHSIVASFVGAGRSVSRPEGAVGIIWVYIGIIVRNHGALRAGKKLYIYLCGLCVARDMPPLKEKETSSFESILHLANALQVGHLPLNTTCKGGTNRARRKK